MHRPPKLFYEAYQWFLGAAVHLGDKTATKHDPAAFSDSSKTRYVSPGLGCAKNHIIYLANGRPSDNDNNALALLRRINPSAARTRIPVSESVNNSDEANWADEFAAFFNRGSDLDTTLEGAQNISVHTLAVTGRPATATIRTSFAGSQRKVAAFIRQHATATRSSSA